MVPYAKEAGMQQNQQQMIPVTQEDLIGSFGGSRFTFCRNWNGQACKLVVTATGVVFVQRVDAKGMPFGPYTTFDTVEEAVDGCYLHTPGAIS